MDSNTKIILAKMLKKILKLEKKIKEHRLEINFLTEMMGDHIEAHKHKKK